MKSFILPAGKLSLLRFIEEHGEEKLLFEVRPYKKPRSLDANAYWWGVIVTPLAEYCGYTPNEMHVELCGSYFGWKQSSFRGHEREVPRRTTTHNEKGEREVLATMDFADLINHGQKIMAEMGVPISEVA